MRTRAFLLSATLATAALLTACGGGDEGDEEAAGQVATVTSAATSVAGAARATAAPSGPMGDPPGSPAAQRLDDIMKSVRLPDTVTWLGRRDMTNESESAGKADLLKQFEDTGREIGAQYVFAINGTQRISLGVNQYKAQDGALSQYTTSGGGRTDLANPIPAQELGDYYTGAKVEISPGTWVNNIVFVRGRYYVTIADFDRDGGKDSPADIVVALARALDAELQKNPPPSNTQ